MFGAPKVPEVLQEAAKPMITLQSKLMDIKRENLSRTTTFLKESEWMSDPNNHSSLIHEILMAMELQYLAFDLLSTLILDLVKIEPKLVDNILKYVFTPTNNYRRKLIRAKLIRKLTIRGFVDVLALAKQVRRFSKRFKNEVFLYFVYIGEELEKTDPKEYTRLLRELKTSISLGPHLRKSLEEELIPLIEAPPSDTKWLKLNVFLDRGYTEDSVEGVLAEDNVPKLSQIIGEDYDRIIPYSVFSTHELVNGQPTLVQYAASRRSQRCTKYLLNFCDKERRDEFGQSLADYAVAGGSPDVVRIVEGAGVSCVGSISIAAAHRTSEVFFSLWKRLHAERKHKAVVDPLLRACAAANNIELLVFCLENGAKVNDADAEGRVALHHAAIAGNTLATRLLVMMPDVDVNARDEIKRTALHYAVEIGNEAAVRALLAAGADVGAKDQYGKVPYDLSPNKGFW